jgi:hypothetical protein
LNIRQNERIQSSRKVCASANGRQAIFQLLVIIERILLLLTESARPGRSNPRKLFGLSIPRAPGQSYPGCARGRALSADAVTSVTFLKPTHSHPRID